MIVKVMRVGSVDVPLPCYQTAGAAGMDLHAAIAHPIMIPSLGRVKVPTGLTVAIPHGFEGQVRPRSGLAARSGVTVLNSPGTVDSDYRGEIEVLLVNLGLAPVNIFQGQRIAQIVFARCERAEMMWSESLDPTDRGGGGFGHTGH